MGTFGMAHRRYAFGDPGAPSTPEAITRACATARVWLPVYMYDHGGQTINTTGFSCSWDSGQIGAIWMTADEIRRAFGVTRITARVEAQVRDTLRKAVAQLDMWLTGDVWDIDVMNAEGIVVDSLTECYGRAAAEDEAAHMVAVAQVQAQPIPGVDIASV